MDRCFALAATIIGTPGDELLRGTRKHDVIVGLGGDDTVAGVDEYDTVCSGPGDDVVRARGGRDVDLGPGDDRFTGSASRVLAGTGDDTIRVNAGAGDLSGGQGNDYIGRTLGPRAGYPTEAPCVSYEHSARGVHVDLGQGWARGLGEDTLIGLNCMTGSRYDDVLVGTQRADLIDTGGGLNTVASKSGGDGIYAGNRADLIRTGPGNDTVYAGGGWDRVYGGAGADSLRGEGQGDYLAGGFGDDKLYGGVECDPASSYGYSTVDKAPNQLVGGPGDDDLNGDLGNDSLDGGPGFDRGQGGYHDRRADLVTSLEAVTAC